MAAYPDRIRYRSRQPVKKQPRTDAVTTALTAQVVLCIILILVLLLLKKMNEPLFAETKQEYTALTSNSATFPNFSEMWASLIASFERLFGGEKQEQPDPGAFDEPSDAEDEPSDPANLDYNYLEDKTVAYTAAQGGLFPVTAEDTGDLLPPPQGCVLSPVYLDAKAVPPVTGVITSPFSYRNHPVTGNSDFHNGLDIAAEEGRAILAALPGEVDEVGESEIYGKYITIKHSTNLSTFYAHCSEIIAEEGIAVRQGERIALVGQTGLVTGPHLHFSVIVEGAFTDPSWILSDYIQLVE